MKFALHIPRPSVPWGRPQESFVTQHEVNKTQIYDEDELNFEEGKRYKFSKEWDGDSYEYFLIEFTEEVKTNPKYAEEKAAYDKAVAEVAEWDEGKAAFEKQEQAKRTEAKERAEYERLKKIYGS